jgi:hypothetical protein
MASWYSPIASLAASFVGSNGSRIDDHFSAFRIASLIPERREALPREAWAVQEAGGSGRIGYFKLTHYLRPWRDSGFAAFKKYERRPQVGNLLRLPINALHCRWSARCFTNSVNSLHSCRTCHNFRQLDTL